MRKPGGVVTAIAVAGLLAAIAATPSDAAARRHGRPGSRAYDGLWSVSIRTQFGPCDPSFRYPARIVGGRLQQADNDFNYRISGAVVGNGAIGVTVSSGGGSATGFGRLRGATGGGRWSTAGGRCYGVWTADRRAAN
jgi:hypothetical protein